MTHLPSTSRLALWLMIFFCVTLNACTLTKKLTTELKTGMYIDAVLEFVVAYPLEWEKDRRLTYGSKEGEVRWRHPDHPETLLRISSSLQNQTILSEEQQLNQALQEYAGLKISLREQVALPAGEAWHITGQTTHEIIDLYLLLHTDRRYLIAITTESDDMDQYADITEKVIHSFQLLPQNPSQKQPVN